MQANKKIDRTFVDGAIRAKTVLLIDELGNKVGNIPTYEALSMARESGLNLVQVSSGFPPTCKIFDYGKFKYDESKKIKAQLKKQRESKIEEREIIFRPNTDQNDLKIKAKKALEFLDNGDRVRLTIKCKGRETSHPEIMNNTLNAFIAMIPNGAVIPTTNESRGRFSYIISRTEPGKRQ